MKKLILIPLILASLMPCAAIANDLPDHSMITMTQTGVAIYDVTNAVFDKGQVQGTFMQGVLRVDVVAEGNICSSSPDMVAFSLAGENTFSAGNEESTVSLVALGPASMPFCNQYSRQTKATLVINVLSSIKAGKTFTYNFQCAPSFPNFNTKLKQVVVRITEDMKSVVTIK
jgi:hypothetical protein